MAPRKRSTASGSCVPVTIDVGNVPFADLVRQCRVEEDAIEEDNEVEEEFDRIGEALFYRLVQKE